MLFRRRGSASWYFRKVIPPALRPILRKTAIVVSLKTSDYETAKARHAVESVKAARLLQHARLTLQRPEAVIERQANEITRQWRRDGFQAEDDDAEGEVLHAELDRLRDKAALTIEDQATIQAYSAMLNGGGSTDLRDNPPVSEVFERWRVERRPSAHTWREFDRALRACVETVGDLPVRSLRKDHIRAVKAALLASISKRDGKTLLKPTTAQKLLAALSAVLSWAEREGITDTNVAHGVSRIASLMSKADTVDDRRMPFTVAQARSIIEKLPADGQGSAQVNRWLWLIGLYSGMRLSEAAGLRREDVREVDGVLCFDLRPHEGRGLKNKSSRRIVPVHPELLAAGFSADVLPFLTRGKKTSGHYWGRRVNKWLREVVGISDPRLSYHSARHTVRDRLRAARVPEPEQRALLGWSAKGVADSYGLGFPTSVLQDAMTEGPLLEACC